MSAEEFSRRLREAGTTDLRRMRLPERRAELPQVRTFVWTVMDPGLGTAVGVGDQETLAVAREGLVSLVVRDVVRDGRSPVMSCVRVVGDDLEDERLMVQDMPPWAARQLASQLLAAADRVDGGR